MSRLRLKSWTLLAYGGPALPLVLSEIPILIYLPAFYAQEIALSVGLVGLVFLSARIWDGVFDLMVGSLSDRTRSRWGRRKPWVVIGSPFLMISTWFLCNPPESAGLMYLVVWAALFYTADAIVKIPHLSWGAELATDYVERSRVTAFRGIFSMLGTLVFVAAPLVFLDETAPLSEILLLVSLSVLAIVPLTTICVAWLVPDSAQAARAREPGELLRALTSLVKDRVLLGFCTAILLYFIGGGVMNSMAVFLFNVGMQLPGKFSWILFILYGCSLCALPLLMRLARHVEKQHLLAGAIGVIAIAYASHLLIPVGNFPIVVALWIVVGVSSSAVLTLPTSILADIIDRGELAAGERLSGAYMAVYNLIMKIGLALGVGLSFGLLELIGYEPSAAQHSDLDVRNVRLLGFALPCLLFVPSILLIWKHPITRKVQQQLRAQIDARNGVDGLERAG